MKIKEVEARTGVLKANIRYYESQGLIEPRREANGYRAYDEAHVTELRKIKLLRELDLSIDTIKALRRGSLSLEEALFQRKARFSEQHRQLDGSETVVDLLLAARPEYDTLDPSDYLPLLGPSGQASRQDVQTKPLLPWRRFWARTFDFALYNLLLYAGFPSLFQTGGFSLLPILAEVLMLVALEPVMLWCFCTTPGKFLFGITVTSPEGRRLTYGAALERTLLVLRHGLGFCLPFLRESRHLGSFATVDAGGDLIWERSSELNIRDTSPWRYIPFCLLLAGILAYPARAEFHRLFVPGPARYAGETPFLTNYRVEEVLYALEPDMTPPLVRLTTDALAFSSGDNTAAAYDTLGVFRYAPPEEDPTAGVWELSTGAATAPLYRLTVGEDDGVVLACYENFTLQWQWKLQSLDVLDVEVRHPLSTLYLPPQWYPTGTFSGDIRQLRPRRFGSDSTITLIFHVDTPETLPVIEEAHSGDDVTVRELELQKDENGRFQIDYTPVPGQDAYILYRVPSAGGELLFCVLC